MSGPPHISPKDISEMFGGEVCEECNGEGGFPTVEEALREGLLRQICCNCNGKGYLSKEDDKCGGKT